MSGPNKCIGIDSNVMSLEVGRMGALAEAVQREAEGMAKVDDHTIWLIDLLNADLAHLKSRINDGHYDRQCEGGES